jgi:hypothetical protein
MRTLETEIQPEHYAKVLAHLAKSVYATTFEKILCVCALAIAFAILTYAFVPPAQFLLAFALDLLVIISVALFISTLVRMRYARWLAKRKYFNIGPATYTIAEDHIEFQGTSFRCEIPFSAMQSVHHNEHVAFFAYSDDAGFILPSPPATRLEDVIAFAKTLGAKANIPINPAAIKGKEVRGNDGRSYTLR